LLEQWWSELRAAAGEHVAQTEVVADCFEGRERSEGGAVEFGESVEQA
jgi:hypothetical protein